MNNDAMAMTNDREAQVAALLEQMTLEEKVSLMGGASMWLTEAAPRLGIPAIKVTDGPNGARGGGSYVGGIGSACFPAAISLSATWNTDLVRQVGEALGEEAKTKGAHLLLAPTVNIQRHPLGGRNFECYSEDPFLSARMAVAYIEGVQSRGVGATVKHFVNNDSEFERNTIDIVVSQRALREIYLPPFEAAVKEAGAWAVMASYNRVNGPFAAENADLQRRLLKEEWGFDGIVMSDWTGTQSTVASANNGLDLEMPGPPVYFGEKLLQAVRVGEVDQAAVDEAAARMLRVILRSAAKPGDVNKEEASIDNPRHRAIARRAAAEGIVLLKHEGGVLPLAAQAGRSLAIIGPNAKAAQIMGGGSAQVNAHYAVSPFEGIVARVADETKIKSARGCHNDKYLPLLDMSLIASGEEQEPGHFAQAIFDNIDLQGTPVDHQSLASAEKVWVDEATSGVSSAHFSTRIGGVFRPRESGAHQFSLVSAGLSRLDIDGELLIDNWSMQTPGEAYFGFGSQEAAASIELHGGQAYTFTIEYSSGKGNIVSGLRLGHRPPSQEDDVDGAAALAAGCDVALLFVGLNGEWDSEGYDRKTMDLPGAQDALVKAVAAANPNTIVVLQSGAPVSMPWLDDVAAVLQAWYPGQECGNAIADVLFGDVNPCGRLPQTFPKRLEDSPAFLHYPGEQGKMHYGEGVFAGYRSYDKRRVEPLFAFGHGLSYTEFTYGALVLAEDEISAGEKLSLSLNVTNSGERTGQEVVQIYVSDSEAAVNRPPKELKAFAKVALEPGQTKRVEFELDRRALAYWDESRDAWTVEAGEFRVLAGASATDIRATAAFTLLETTVFGGPGASDAQAAEERLPATWSEGDLDTGEVRLHYYRTGGDKRPLLLAHGVTDNGLCWLPLARSLSEDYDVIMVDARGHGQSERPDSGYAAAQHAADLLAVIEGLALDRPALLGHSMGAMTVSLAAARKPEVVSAVIMEDPPWWEEEWGTRPDHVHGTEIWRQELTEMQSQTAGDLVLTCEGNHPDWHGDEHESWARAKLEVSPQVLDYALAEAEDWRETVKALQVPALLITADVTEDPDNSAIVTPDVAARAAVLNKHLEPVYIPGAAHSIRRDQPQKYLAAVRRFLIEHYPPATAAADG